MELVTFQTMDAFKKLVKNGYLECDEKYINMLKAKPSYDWVIEKMNEIVKENKDNIKYPLWAWVKYKNGICPPKHRRKEPVPSNEVKITFIKDEKDLFITNFRTYSFVLNNMYLPSSKKDYEWSVEEMAKRKISIEDLKAYVRKDKYDIRRTDAEFLDFCKIIRKSWGKCITNESDILQACFWRLDLKDVVKIEFCNDDNYNYGSPNYLRANGKRPEWVKKYIASLK